MEFCKVFILLFLSFPASLSVFDSHFKKGKICMGTNIRMSVHVNRERHYQNLRDRYINCTYVDGNLEITWIKNPNRDMSFLNHIREVTGYVLISHVDVKHVILPNLQIIRGRNLFKPSIRDDEFGLMVTMNNMLTVEIVGIIKNFNLCHVKTINWTEVISGRTAQYIYNYNFTTSERECPPCHESCKSCWGDGKHNCQKFSKIICAPQCHQGRCYGEDPRQCCHLFCAGGCTGPKQSDCLACKNFYEDGMCKQECPPMKIYNPSTYLWEHNPHGKYAYGATCVKNCPEHLLKDSGACVRNCPKGKKPENGECVPCRGPCPKTCSGVKVVSGGNIENFKDCTVVEGSLTILDSSFTGYQEVYKNYTFGPHHKKMPPSALDVFSTLKVVTGFINIQAKHPNFTELSFLRNLEVIGGRENSDLYAALYIAKTSLQALNLQSLKKIASGGVAIVENEDLCFAHSINWEKLMYSSDHKPVLDNNMDKASCQALGRVCHEECADSACWGAGPNHCFSCKNFKLGDQCIERCNPGLGYGNGNCTKCKNLRDGHYCVSECPKFKYPTDDGICFPCHEDCVGGCTGPGNALGEGACNSCHRAIIKTGEVDMAMCLKENEPCPIGYYMEWVGPVHGKLQVMAGKTICRECHHRCKNCTNYGFHVSVCHECAQYRWDEQCVEECPRDHCAAHCPDDKPYKIFTDDMKQAYCSEADAPIIGAEGRHQKKNSDDLNIIIGSCVGGFILLCMISMIMFIVWRYYMKVHKKSDALKMTMQMMGTYDDGEPLKPSNIKPNLAKLRIVTESELRLGGALGYGAFGTVYKGVWVPAGENVKVPVAIKVLRDKTNNANKDILEEAYIMASVQHPNLVQLLAVCMTSKLMLVTQLMPLGCLLDYVRTHKDMIGSRPLLSWCTQIAKGMSYLEEKRLVHRDLAARNVLVRTPNCVKITDFGLAKLLDLNQAEYKSEGGKMPIKWLALECIQHRIFTHKSDVWAFGVTVWELLFYGAKPYESVPAKDVPALLEKGERLPQPPICTIDVYMLMIKCWMLDAESRPSFKELAEEFGKMTQDPVRYLVVPGDRVNRLPTYSPQHERDLLSTLADGPEVMMEAEEYLQPKVSHENSDNRSTSTNSIPPPPYSACMNGEGPENGVKKGPSSNDSSNYPDSIDSNATGSPRSLGRRQKIRDKKYAHLEAAAANSPNNGRRDNCISDRYSTDPLKMIGRESDAEEGGFTDGPKKPPILTKVGGIPVELKISEDDYLLPNPIKSGGNASGYMDLISDATRTPSTTPSADVNFLPEFVPVPPVSTGTPKNVGLDNPEYHIMNGNAISQLNGVIAPVRRKTNSSDDDTDHEYYNDYDKLKRELQPLYQRRSICSCYTACLKKEPKQLLIIHQGASMLPEYKFLMLSRKTSTTNNLRGMAKNDEFRFFQSKLDGFCYHFLHCFTTLSKSDTDEVGSWTRKKFDTGVVRETSRNKEFSLKHLHATSTSESIPEVHDKQNTEVDARAASSVTNNSASATVHSHKMDSTRFKLVIYAIGIFFCYFYYGILQEKM
ncbi:Epidermal growth factor receptor [Nymphon striatum]|nr:Epidermal growth factor receptor [Nymphon striatum]